MYLHLKVKSVGTDANKLILKRLRANFFVQRHARGAATTRFCLNVPTAFSPIVPT